MCTTMSNKLFLVGAAVCLASTTLAQSATPDSGRNTLDEVTITANKILQKQSQTGKVVTVISQQDIAANAGKTLGQLLNEQAGLTINGALNNLGTNQTVYLRGAGAGRTLILVDGVPAYDPSLINNEFDLNLIPLALVERIEVARGAQSTLYGSDAIGGVINIITTAPANKRIGGTAGLSYGRFGTLRADAQLQGQLQKFDYSIRYGYLNSQGFSTAQDRTNAGNFDKDGYEQHAVNARAGYQLSKALKLSSYLQYSDYQTDLDNGIFRDDRDYTSASNNLLTGLTADWKKEKYQLKLHYMYSHTNRNLLDDSTHVGGFAKFSTNDFYGKAQFAELYGSFQLSKRFTLLAGTDFRYSSMNSRFFSLSSFGPFTDAFKDTSLYQASAYSSLLYGHRWLHIEAGIRWNYHQRYGNNATYTFNPSVRINSQWRVFGSIASGFKAPSIYQLYSAFGNENLEPETSVNYELGVQYGHKQLRSRLVYFHRKINNGLDFDNINFVYFNYNRQTVNGLELETEWKPLQQLTITANYTWLSPTEQSQSRITNKDSSYSYLLRRPQHQLQASVAWQVSQQVLVSVQGRYVGQRYDVGGFRQPDVALSDYFLLGAHASWQATSRLSLFADVQNIANTSFVEIRGYNSMPRNVQAGARFRF